MGVADDGPAGGVVMTTQETPADMLLMCSVCGHIATPEEWTKLDCPACRAPAYDACVSVPKSAVELDGCLGRFVLKADFIGTST